MTVLGHRVEDGQPVHLTEEARRQGVYLIGTTGCGKTTLLQNIAYQDMANPQKPGLCVLDPHGDFIDELLARVPGDRWEDVIIFDPGDEKQRQRPMGLNILECDRRNPKQVYRVTSTVIDTLRKLFFYSWGPRMEDLLRYSILTLMETPDTTLLDLLLLLASESHRQNYTANLKDPLLNHFWKVQFAAYSKREVVEVVGSSLNKVGRFLSNPLIRNIVSQPQSSFSMRQIMDQGKILLINLSKGDLGEDNSFLLGAVLINLVLIAALQRREIAPNQRRPFHLIVDEFQNFATESFATLQSEARKYGVTIMVAHQYRDQLDELNLGSTLNVANFIAMRVSGKDSQDLAGQFDNTPPAPDKTLEPVARESKQTLPQIAEPLYEIFAPANKVGTLYREKELPRRAYSDVQAETANRLTTLPNWTAVCRLIGEGGLTETTIKTQPPLGEVSEGVRSRIRRYVLQYGRELNEVEAEIARKIEGVEFPAGSVERDKLGLESNDDDDPYYGQKTST